MKLCRDCTHHHLSRSTGAICTRPFQGKPINDLVIFQRRHVSIWDQWFGGQSKPCGYCGPNAKFFNPKRDIQRPSCPVE